MANFFFKGPALFWGTCVSVHHLLSFFPSFLFSFSFQCFKNVENILSLKAVQKQARGPYLVHRQSFVSLDLGENEKGKQRKPISESRTLYYFNHFEKTTKEGALEPRS